MTYHFLPGDFLSRRALAFCGIATFHVLIAYLLLTALVQPAPRVADTPIVGFVVPAAPPQAASAVPDVRPRDNYTRIEVPPTPEVALPHDAPAMGAVAAGDPLAGGSTVAPAVPPVRLLGVNQLPNTEEYYPPDMRRQNVQGATNVRVCVDPQGMPVGDPTIERSSGYPRLDMGAVNVARHGRYARSVQGDTPVGNCFRFRIAFKMPQ